MQRASRARMSSWVMAVAAAAVLAITGSASAAEPKLVPAPEDAFTPVTVTPLGPSTTPVQGTDGRWHVVYELQLLNGKPAPATIEQVDVVDAARPSRVLASFAGDELLGRLRTTFPSPAEEAVIPPSGVLLLYIELSFPRRSAVPRFVAHRLRLLASANPGATEPTPMRYTAGRYGIRDGRPVVLGPPLRGDDWVATNGCCSPAIVHRGSVQTVNGGLFDAQRFAIDWIRLNADGRFFTGDGSDVRQHAAYDAPVLAVADGVVVSTLDTLPDQVPGTLPPPASITLQTVDGNHVVIALGDGRYAFYAHLRRGSVRVKRGDRVRRGQVIGRLGNSGNTSAPHLHFHVMRSPSVLGSDGLPFAHDRFSVTGKVSATRFEEAEGLDGVWGENRFAPRPQRDRFPLNLDVVAFPGR